MTGAEKEADIGEGGDQGPEDKGGQEQEHSGIEAVLLSPVSVLGGGQVDQDKGQGYPDHQGIRQAKHLLGLQRK